MPFRVIIPDLLSRYPAYNRIGFNVFGDDRACRHHCSLANGYTWHDGGIHPDEGTFADADFTDDLFSFIEMPGQVVRNHYAHSRERDVIFDDNEFGSPVIDQYHVPDLDPFTDMHAFQAME